MAEENNSVTSAPMEEDTRTRRTVRLRSIASEVAAATPAAPAMDDTVTRKTIKLKPMGVADGEDTRTRKTVVIRPAAAAEPADTADDDRTIKIQRPAAKVRPMPPKPPVPLAGVGSQVANVPQIPTPQNPENDLPVEDVYSGSGKGSTAVTVLAAVALICMLATAALTTVHYLKYEQGMDIAIPGLSK